MNWYALAISTGLSILFLVVVFRPLEMVFPAKPGQRFFRPAWFTDLCFLLGQYLVWGSLVLWVLTYVNYWLNGIMPHGFRQAVAAQPWWLQAIEVVALSDFFVYWGHRLQHRVGFLWRFHAVHHSAQHLDWLAAHREHPLDTIYTVGLINLPAFLLGFPLETIAGFIAFRGIWAIYIHSNVRLPIGPLRWFIGSPELHHWHHDRDRDAGNYANLSPLMDLLFGTYRCPDHEPEHFGLNEPTPGSYLGHLIQPLLPRKRREQFGDYLRHLRQLRMVSVIESRLWGAMPARVVEAGDHGQGAEEQSGPVSGRARGEPRQGEAVGSAHAAAHPR